MASSSAADFFTFTVGKLDAGMAILLGERAHLIEFPSILLPPGATTGSIVNISVHQNLSEEQRREREFWKLQDDILAEFGRAMPEAPKLSVRNVTQTSVTLEWTPLKLATAKLRSLDIYRNGERLSSVPSPLTNTSTKHSGMEIDAQFTFQLIMRTTAGTFPSNVLHVRTHTMHDTSGISVCFGNVQDPELLENAKVALEEMGAKWSDKIQIDTSHFVCTTPAATPVGAHAVGNTSNVPGVMYQRALQLSIPVVQPQWILACHAERRMMPIAPFKLDASTTPSSASFHRPQSMSQVSLPHTPASGGPKASPASYRASMPPTTRAPPAAPSTPPSQASAFINQPSSANEANRQPRNFVPAVKEENEIDDPDTETVRLERTPISTPVKTEKRKSRTGTMNREFKFPPETPPPIPPTEAEPNEPNGSNPTSSHVRNESEDNEHRPKAATPTTIEVPAPPPMEKERTLSHVSLDSTDDDVGDIVEVDLN